MRTHTVQHRKSSSILQNASLGDLVDRINSEATKISTLNATVDIDTSVGGEQKGHVTDYQEIRGYVLLRRPSSLRMIGLFPLVRNRVFDMVSNGETFRLSLPTKNKFIVGSKDVTTPSKQPLENLRPQHILDALLLREIPKTDIAVLESATEMVRDSKTNKVVDQPDYIVAVIHHLEDGNWVLTRKIVFSREDLRPRKQIIYDKNGNIETIASYENYSDYSGIPFPNIIQIQRPQEEYSIQLGMVKVRLNEPITDEQFTLAQPPGSQLVRMDNQNPSADPKPDSASHNDSKPPQVRHNQVP